MKPGVNYVPKDKFLTIVAELGLEAQEQAGFVKVKGPHQGNLYVAKSKDVGRVDLSGFTVDDPGVYDLRGEATGAVKQRLDFSLSEAEVLAAFRRVCEHMKNLGPVAPREKKAKAPQATTTGTAPAQETPPEDPRAKRLKTLRLMQKIAATKPEFQMNPQLVEELKDLEDVLGRQA